MSARRRRLLAGHRGRGRACETRNGRDDRLAALIGRERRLQEELGRLRTELLEAQVSHAGLAGALGRLQDGLGTEGTALAIAHRVAGLPDAVAGAVLAFGEDGDSRALAVAPDAAGGPSVLLASAVLHPERRRRLSARAIDGPWMDRWPGRGGGERGRGDGPTGARASGFATDALRAILYAPMVADGRTIGLLVAAAERALPSDRATRRLALLADHATLATTLLAPALGARGHLDARAAHLRAIIELQEFVPVFQPIVDLALGEPIGFEALTRFRDGTPPGVRFEEAEALGLSLELESAALRAATRAARALPEWCWLSVNVSPRLLLEPGVLEPIVAEVGRPLVLELTERIAIEDHAAVRVAVDRLGPDVRLAIDDAGAGHSSFRSIVELAPDFVKLDMALVRGIDDDERRQALVVGLRYYALRTGCTLVAEGVETAAEKETLEQLDVRVGQGFLLGRPGAVGTTGVVTRARAERS